MDKEKLLEDCIKSLKEDFRKSDSEIKRRNYEQIIKEHLEKNPLSIGLSGYALATYVLSEAGDVMALERYLM